MDLVIGRGEIGRGLFNHLRRFGETILRAHDDLPGGNFDCVYICSGVTKTRECEEDPGGSRRVNVEFPIEISRRYPWGIWISSERVFDGQESYREKGDAVSPVTEYGRQKVEGEASVLSNGYGVIRFGKVLGWDMPLFEGWVNDLRQGKAVHPFKDMSMAPVSIGQAVEVLRKMGTEKRSGLHQLSGDRDISYDRIAKHLCNYLGYDLDLVQGISGGSPHPHTTLASDFESPNSWDVINEWCGKRLLY